MVVVLVKLVGSAIVKLVGLAIQACGIGHSQLVGTNDLFSFFAEVCFFQFLGCPCTNLAGNLPERKTLAILQNNQN